MTDSAPGAEARAETTAKTKTVTYGKLKLKVPTKLPFNTLGYLRNDMDGGDVIGALASIIGPEQMQVVTEANFNIDEGNDLLDKVLKAAGVGPGN